MTFPAANNEKDRLQSLNQYNILDTLPEECFDRIVAMAAEICETPIALFTLVGEQRQWFKSTIGLDIQETARTVSFCAHAVADDAFLMVEDAAQDSRFANNPLVLGTPEIRFYAGVPIHCNNNFPLGTLCVIDRVPKSLSVKNRLLLESLAREVESQLEIRRISNNQQRLIEERAVLLNIVSHDARGIFSVLDWGIESLKKDAGVDGQVVDQFQDAINVLQNLCEGMLRINDHESIDLKPSLRSTKLQPWLESFARRASTAIEKAGMHLTKTIDIADRQFVTDTYLLGRILENLYMNAIQACSAGDTITIRAHMESDSVLVIIVEDNGPGVAEENAKQIFEPYFSVRGSGQHGDGLGLPVCRLATEALSGEIIHAPGDPSGARFVVRLPV